MSGMPVDTVLAKWHVEKPLPCVLEHAKDVLETKKNQYGIAEIVSVLLELYTRQEVLDCLKGKEDEDPLSQLKVLSENEALTRIKSEEKRIYAIAYNKPYIASNDKLKVHPYLPENDVLKSFCRFNKCVLLQTDEMEVYLLFSEYRHFEKFDSLGLSARASHDVYKELSLGTKIIPGLTSDRVIHGYATYTGASEDGDNKAALRYLYSSNLTKNEGEAALAIILNKAVSNDSVTDIIFEPEGNAAKVIYKVDGLCRDAQFQLPGNIYPLLRKTLTTASRNNIMEGRFKDSEDGELTYISEYGRHALRLNYMPLDLAIVDEGTEEIRIVIRIRETATKTKSLQELGVTPGIIDTMRTGLKTKGGLILVAGSTNSGKSTFLVALLEMVKEIYRGSRSVLSIEQPVEMRLPGVSQVSVTEGTSTVRQYLKPFLRQAPDIIFLGEMRTQEEGDFTMHLSLTGHTVVTGIHAGTPSEALGAIKNKVSKDQRSDFVQAIKAIVCLSLSPKLCSECKIEGAAPGENDRKDHVKNCEYVGIDPAKYPLPETMYRASETGCAACGNTGYKGRKSFYSSLFTDYEVKKLIATWKPKRLLECDSRCDERMIQSSLDALAAGVIDIQGLQYG